LAKQQLSRTQPKVTIDNADWKRVFQTSVDALNSKAIKATQPDSNNMQITYGGALKKDYFVVGRAAMTIGSYSMIDQINQAKDLIKDYKPFNWDMVTVPVDPKNPDVTSTSFGLFNLFAINAQTSEQRAAWEFIKYLNGDEFARIMSHSTQQLLSRTSYIKDKEGRNVEALFKLKADTSLYQDYANLPRSFSLSQIVDDEMKPVLEGKKTLDEVLPIIQAKGQEALDKAKVEDEAKKETDGA
jgi:multiple sugar transport system substrate-binding protein